MRKALSSSRPTHEIIFMIGSLYADRMRVGRTIRVRAFVFDDGLDMCSYFARSSGYSDFVRFCPGSFLSRRGPRGMVTIVILYQQ
jgi:hypothetical protein